MVFIGLRAMKKVPGASWKNAGVIHFNPHFIKIVNEKNMTLTLDDNSEYQVDDESLQVFLSAMYGEDTIRGDKLENGRKII